MNTLPLVSAENRAAGLDDTNVILPTDLRHAGAGMLIRRSEAYVHYSKSVSKKEYNEVVFNDGNHGRSPFQRSATDAIRTPGCAVRCGSAAGCAVEMELLCAELALERTKGKLPPGKFLTINLGPDALTLAAEKLPLAGRQEVMFELTEHLPLNEAQGLRDAVERLRTIGIGLALDDTGCGFADLDTVRLLKPEIVKLCITVIRNADKGAPFAAAIRASAEQLCKLGCKVLAEGVETAAQHDALQSCGIELAQGWLYGKPAAVASLPGGR